MTFFYISLLNWGVFLLGCGVAVYFQVRYIRARKCAEEALEASAEVQKRMDEEGSYRLLHADLLRRHKARVGEFEELIEGLKESLIDAGTVCRSVGDERDEAVAALDKTQRWIETTLDKEVED